MFYVEKNIFIMSAVSDAFLKGAILLEETIKHLECLYAMALFHEATGYSKRETNATTHQVARAGLAPTLLSGHGLYNYFWDAL